MTSLVSWVGVDSRGPASIYIATDSRITWEADKHWDAGRKVFASRNCPDILGYVGDVLFPSLVLGQIVNAIDEGLIFEETDSPKQRFDRTQVLIKKTFDQVPREKRNAFCIAYATREGEEMDASFYFFSLKWSLEDGWSEECIDVPNTSDTIVIWGSGKGSILRWKERWNNSSQKSTSRSIFGCLCDSIFNGSDVKSGGSPQLVGLYRVGSGRTFGIVEEEKPYLFGLPIQSGEFATSSIEWRNRYFERCGHDGKRLACAKKHHVPKGLGGRQKTLYVRPK